MAVIVDKSALSAMSLVKGFTRLNPFPLDKTSFYTSLSEAQEYAATSPVALAGQVISVVEGGVVTIYKINVDGTLSALGADTSSDLQSLSEQVSENTSALEVLNGDEETEGSVAKAIADAIAELPADLVVSSGSVVIDPEGEEAGTYLKLILSNEDVVYIPASELVDTYEGSDYIEVENYTVSLKLDELKSELGVDNFATKDDLDSLATKDELGAVEDKADAAQSAAEAAQSTANEADAIAKGNATSVANIQDDLYGHPASGEGDDAVEAKVGLVDLVDALRADVDQNKEDIEDLDSRIESLEGADPFISSVSENSELSVEAGVLSVDLSAYAKQADLEELQAAVEAIEHPINGVSEAAVDGLSLVIGEDKNLALSGSVSIDDLAVSLSAGIGEIPGENEEDASVRYAEGASIHSVLSDMDARIAANAASIAAAVAGGVTSIVAGDGISVNSANSTQPVVSLKLDGNTNLKINENKELSFIWIEE